MSDSDESGIAYTEVSSPSEDLSNIGSPRADDHEYLELPEMPEDPYVEATLQAPPSLDYVHGPEEPKQASLSPDYVLGLEHTDDEIVAKDQLGAEDASPTAQSPGYVPESDPEADPEEDDDEVPEEGPVDYPADGGNDGDDEEGSSEDDEDDDMDIEADNKEEEEHLAPANSVVVTLPATDQALSVEETEPFETDESVATPPPHPAYRVTARISIPAPLPTPLWSDAEVSRLLAISTPPSSPLSPWSSPLPQIPSPPLPPIPSPSLPLSPPSPVLSPAPPPSPIHAPSSVIPPPLPISVPTSSPPLLLPSASRGEDRPKVTLPPQKRLGIALGPRHEVGESSSAAAARPAGGLRADYGFGAPVSTDTELGRHMTAFETRVRQDTDEIYTRLDDEQSQRQLLFGRLNMLFRDRRAHAYTRQMLKIRKLHAADRRRQAMTSEMLKADHKRSAEMRELWTANRTRQQQLTQTLIVMQSLQGQMTTLQGHVIALQGQAMIDQGVTAALAACDANRNGDDSHTSGTGGRRTERWFERMETVFRISNCSVENQIKFSTCTLLAGALTWWNSHVLTASHDVAYAMTWADLRKKMTNKYCPRNEMKKIKAELMFHEESDKIERYAGRLPDMIHGNILASKPKTMQEAVEMATELKDKKVSTIAERQSENKRKFENTSRNNQNQQQQNKRQNTGRAYTAGTGEKKPCEGSKPLCVKCNYHHDGLCAPKCHKCNKFGHFSRDCRSAGNANNANNQRGTGSGQKSTCFECGVQGHFKRECPKLKNNKNHGNQVGNDRAPAKVYAVGHAGTNPDSNVMMGTFLLNNHYASILFDTGADRSFVSTAFSSQMDIMPSTLDHYYDVELADGRIIGLNTILRGCTLNLLNHPFNINLMPVELGSFDAIIGMDWLAKYQAIIVCAEKIVRIPWGNETLVVHVFLAHVTTNKVEDKSEKKRFEDVLIVRDFPEVFPEDLSGLPPTRQVEFHIDVIPGAAPVARAPY
ncbi:putative reverse transcriptase domain-containing protein [Tanacetum coccineum]